jgi:VanZ family protein
VLGWVASFGVSDKIEHFSAYFVLAAIPVLGFEAGRGVFAALSMIVLGALLDVAQKFIPGRSFEYADIAANSVGVIMGLGIARITRSRLAAFWRRISGRGSSHPG